MHNNDINCRIIYKKVSSTLGRHIMLGVTIVLYYFAYNALTFQIYSCHKNDTLDSYVIILHMRI